MKDKKAEIFYETWDKHCTAITTCTLKRWKKKAKHLGLLTLEELRVAAEDLRADILKVLGD